MAETSLPTISSLWIGPKLSFLEQLCLKSFVDAGHPTKLYVYDEVANIPAGVEVADAQEILPTTEFVINRKSGAPGPHSDRFRYLMLNSTDEIWADTDAYCVKPWPDQPYLFARHFKNVVANGVLRLPRDSAALGDLIAFTDQEFPELPDDFPYIPKDVRAEYDARRGTSDPMHVSELPWEVWGPFAITHFCHQSGEFDHCVDPEVLYPLEGNEINRVLQMPKRAQIELPDNCLSVHFYGSKMRRLLTKRNGVPAEASFLGQLCVKHDIDPNEHPMMLGA